MKKENYMKDLAAIQNMAGKIRTLNEAIQFGEEYEDEPMGDEPMGMEDQCVDGECDLSKMKGKEPTEEDGLRELGEVDQIREIALRGMIKLCKNPEDERYQALKKIFQFCDKAAETKDKENM